MKAHTFRSHLPEGITGTGYMKNLSNTINDLSNTISLFKALADIALLISGYFILIEVLKENAQKMPVLHRNN